MISLDDADTLYVPTCNLLVRRDAYLAAGGMREDLRFGEDVDLCWRLRARGECSRLRTSRRREPQAPRPPASDAEAEGAVRHLRGGPAHAPSRQGASASHSLRCPADVRRTDGLAVGDGEPRLVPLVVVPWAADVARRCLHLRREGVVVPVPRVASSVLRGHLSLVYYLLLPSRALLPDRARRRGLRVARPSGRSPRSPSSTRRRSTTRCSVLDSGSRPSSATVSWSTAPTRWASPGLPAAAHLAPLSRLLAPGKGVERDAGRTHRGGTSL